MEAGGGARKPKYVAFRAQGVLAVGRRVPRARTEPPWPKPQNPPDVGDLLLKNRSGFVKICGLPPTPRKPSGKTSSGS